MKCLPFPHYFLVELLCGSPLGIQLVCTACVSTPRFLLPTRRHMSCIQCFVGLDKPQFRRAISCDGVDSPIRACTCSTAMVLRVGGACAVGLRESD